MTSTGYSVESFCVLRVEIGEGRRASVTPNRTGRFKVINRMPAKRKPNTRN